MDMDSFLQFGGDNIYFTNNTKGEDYIAIEPICKFFDADYNKELYNLKKSFVGATIIEETVYHNAQLITLQFIPTKYVVGWLPYMEVPTAKIHDYFKNH